MKSRFRVIILNLELLWKRIKLFLDKLELRIIDKRLELRDEIRMRAEVNFDDIPVLYDIDNVEFLYSRVQEPTYTRTDVYQFDNNDLA